MKKFDIPASKKKTLGAAGKRLGFSLVEVVMALGICGFCVLAILGLIPVGMSSNRDAFEQTAAASLAASIQSDLRLDPAIRAAQVNVGTNLSPRFRIPFPQQGEDFLGSGKPEITLFVAEDGGTVISTNTISGDSKARYRADVIYGKRDGAAQATPVRILVSWPAVANRTANAWPTNPSGRFELLTSLVEQ